MSNVCEEISCNRQLLGSKLLKIIPTPTVSIMLTKHKFSDSCTFKGKIVFYTF